MPTVKATKDGPNDNLFSELASSKIKHSSEKIVNIVEFAEVPWGLNLKLTPVQKFMLKVMHGLELNDTDRTIIVRDKFNAKTLEEFTEVEFAKWSYEEGKCNIDFSNSDNLKRNFYEILLAIGRRSGKSTIASIEVCYKFYELLKMGDPHKNYNVPPGQEIAVVSCAPTDGQSQIVFNMAQTFSLGCPFLKHRITHPNQKYFELQTDWDQETYGSGKSSKGSIKYFTGGSASNALRGHNSIINIIDEMAFFVENGGRFSIDEVYGALSPTMANFKNKNNENWIDGLMICLTSPYAAYGKFYELFKESFTDSVRDNGNRIAFNYYTAIVNQDASPEAYLRSQYRSDRSRFDREFGAQFDERITTWIDNENLFRQNIKRPYTEHKKGKGGIKYFWGFDLGVTNNGLAVSVAHKDEEKDRIVLDYSEVWFSKGSPVWTAESCDIYRKHKECGRFRMHDQIPLFDAGQYLYRDVLPAYPMFEGTIDQFSGHAFYQILEKCGFTSIELKGMNTALRSKLFSLVKDLYTEDLLDLMDHPVLIPELLNLEAEKLPKDIIKVEKRYVTDEGFQDDISDSFIKAVWLCWSYFHEPSSGGENIVKKISFGNGITLDNQRGEFDLNSQLRNSRNSMQYRRIKEKMHGRNPRRA